MKKWEYWAAFLLVSLIPVVGVGLRSIGLDLGVFSEGWLVFPVLLAVVMLRPAAIPLSEKIHRGLAFVLALIVGQDLVPLLLVLLTRSTLNSVGPHGLGHTCSAVLGPIDGLGDSVVP